MRTKNRISTDVVAAITPYGARVVCTLTGHGLKDPDTAIKQSPEAATCEPEMKKVLNVLGF